MDRLSSEPGGPGLVTEVLGALGFLKVPKKVVRAVNVAPRLWNSPGSLLRLGLLLFVAHVFASIFWAGHGSVTCLGLGGCYLLTSYAAWLRARRSSAAMRARWLLVAAGLELGVLSFALTFYRECVLRAADDLSGIQDVTLLLRGLPFLMAASLSDREHSKTYWRLDMMYALLAGSLAWVALQFHFMTPGTGYRAVSSDMALVLISAANLLVAVLVTTRCFAGEDRLDVRFCRMIAAFLWANAFVTGSVNFYVIRRWQVEPGSPWMLLGDLPVLGLLVGLVLFKERGAERRAKSDPVTIADTVGSLFVPFWILLLAMAVAQRHLFVGMAGVAGTFILYGARSVLLQKQAYVTQQELLKENQSIQDQAFSDGLTGIPNRRNFDLTLEREWKRAQRSRQPLALLMVDIDHFKRLNDEHGHLTGDGCLRDVAGLLRAGLGREADFAARYGGEEFAILLVDTGIEGGRVVAESLRRSVEQYQCVGPEGVELRFTVSIGVASEVPMQQESSVTLVAAADKALYRAKRSGRNRVEVHAWRSSPEDGLL